MRSNRSGSGDGRPGQGGDVAIIGMACIFPGAPTLDAYWQNIVAGVDAIMEVPADRWDPEVFFDPDSTADDRLYCKRGGYLTDLEFNPLQYGIMPIVVDGGEPDQFLSLRVAQEALADAGYADRPFPQERTEIILGRGNYSNRANVNLTARTLGVEQTGQILRRLLPGVTAEDLAAIKGELKASLPPFGPDIAASLIPNLTTGRVANRLDLMGVNFTVDAACASALIATDLAVRDLLMGQCDLALVGGVHLAAHVPLLAVFSQLNALSRRAQIRPFDEDADGTLAGEGVGMVVLKRWEEAKRDGDRIYALIKAVGTSSDGRGQGPLAPRVEGEVLAMRRAHERAGIPPETVGLIEAHGTGTAVGDLAEIQALTRVFGPRKGIFPTSAIGSVKSMIGHLMPAAGIAGLIKAALAIYHKVLPPSLHCERPNPKFELEKTPFYINTEACPWIHGSLERPRRAGVNAFGFGGINAHVVLEEPAGSGAASSHLLPWDTEVCLVQGGSRRDLIEQGARLERWLAGAAPGMLLKDLAYTLNTDLREGSVRLALVASSVEDLQQKLAYARERLADPGCKQIKDVRGVYFFDEPLRRTGKLAFLFPGEASQYPRMLQDLCLAFPEVRAAFDRTDQLFLEEGRPVLPSQYLFPHPGASDAERLEMQRNMWEMAGALAGILTANLALRALLLRLEIRPDIVLGHSSGEYSALVASGIVADDADLRGRLFSLSAACQRLMEEGTIPEAALGAVGADRKSVVSLLQRVGGQVAVAMDNCPHQVVIAGREDAVEGAFADLQARGVVCQRLPFNRAYHSPMFAAVARPLSEFLQSLPVSPPEIEIYSCSTMAPYPAAPHEIRQLVAELWSRPVEFTRSIQALYAGGVRLFVEVGPRGNLTAFVEDILRGRPHLAMACDVVRRSGITQLNHVIGVLAAHGVPMRLDSLYERRSPRRLSLEGPATAGGGASRSRASMPLPLDLPMMRLSPERARTLMHRSPAALGPARPAAAGLSPAGAIPVLSGAASQVMQEHLHTMERFLAVEQEVMAAFLGNEGAAPTSDTPEVHPPAALPRFPFLGRIVSLNPGREVVIRHHIDPEECVFLRDHAFGGHVSDVDGTLQPLPVLPFTMCMELMAEVAATLMPGKVLTGMRQIQTRQWFEVAAPITLEITARMGASGHEVDVQIRNMGGDAGAEIPPEPPAAEGTAVFGDGYPEPVGAASFPPIDERPCRRTAEEMYRERLMFHGPCFQGVASLDAWGGNGIRGILRVLEAKDLFRSSADPHLVTDPVLLDAAGQLLGYWAAERLQDGYLVFPFRLSALEIFGPNPGASERVRCEVEIQEVTPRQVRATMNLFGPDERLRMRLSGWEDWRFFWPREFYDFFRFPKEYLISHPWETPTSWLPRREAFVCQRVSLTPETTLPIVTHALARMILSRTERAEFSAVRGPERRETEWVFGRAVAKDAVRRLLAQRDGVGLCPADIEIGKDRDGRPFAGVSHLTEPEVAPSISITHTDGEAAAIAGQCLPGEHLGIDIERIRPRQEGFRRIAFDPDELTLLDSLTAAQRDEWVTRLWCAKEAVGKALGKGLAEGPGSVRVRTVDVPAGRVQVVLGDGLAGEFPELAGTPLIVHTAREGDLAVATTLCQRSGGHP